MGGIGSAIDKSFKEAEARLFSLERRFRDLAVKSVTFLSELADVDITYESTDLDSVADGDVLTYDAESEKWVASPVEAGGNCANTGRCSGDETYGNAVEDFVLGGTDADPSMELVSVMVYGEGFEVAQGGVYLVATTCYATDGSAVDFRTVCPDGWQYGDESGQCRYNSIMYESIAAGEDGAGMAQTFMLRSGAAVYTEITSGTGNWTMSVTFLAAADIQLGECGS